jgi:hypothetical protein
MQQVLLSHAHDQLQKSGAAGIVGVGFQITQQSNQALLLTSTAYASFADGNLSAQHMHHLQQMHAQFAPSTCYDHRLLLRAEPSMDDDITAAAPQIKYFLYGEKHM